MKKYVSFFKRDSKPIIDTACKVLKQVIIVGDIVVPILEKDLVDEVRFYSKEIAFVKDGEFFDFLYKEVKAEVYHSYDEKKHKAPSVKVKFVTDSGEVFQLDLTQKNNKISTASFTNDSRDFLYQIASKFSRIREKRFKYRNAYFVELFCLASIMAIVLVK